MQHVAIAGAVEVHRHGQWDSGGSARTELDVQWLSSERFTGGYMRRLSLGPDIDADHITATYHNGVLTVTLPVAAKAKPRRIEITRGAREETKRSSSPATHPTPARLYKLNRGYCW